ncbi:MAG: hypothetical protein JO283_00860 [Bradyrhizobium sp.]|nr:hypothetical protein [Bradyrhizobium sp.]
MHKQNICLGEPQCRLKRQVLRPDHGAKERIGKVPPDNGADLRDLARWAKPVQSRGQRLLQCRRDRMGATVLAAL